MNDAIFPPGNWIGWALEPRPKVELAPALDATAHFERGGRRIEGVEFEVRAEGRLYRVALRRDVTHRLTGTLNTHTLPGRERIDVIPIACSLAQGADGGGLLLGRNTWPHPTLGDREWLAHFDHFERAEYWRD